MAEKSQEQKDEDKKFHLEVIKQTVTLSTAGFGLAAALAWNTLIQEFINTYFRRFIPGDGKLLSMLLYAVLITVMAVGVTVYLSRLARRVEKTK